MRMVMNSTPQVFLFLSQLLGKKIVDPAGRPWGKVCDLVVTMAELYPPVTGVFFTPFGEKTFFRFSWTRILELGENLRVEPLKG
jgi:magnesium transporter